MKPSALLALRISLLVAATALAACDRNEHGNDHGATSAKESALPAAAVRVAEARPLDEIRRVELPGTVRAVESAQLAPKIMGAVESIPVALGQRVKRGDALARLSAGEINAKLSQAETGLAQAERDLKRERALLAKEASTADTVRNLEDRKRIAQAIVDEARAMLRYTTIAAPFDGVVIRKLANEGDLAAPGHPLLALENPARLRVEADVPESLPRLAIGDVVPIRAGGAEDGEIAGKLAEVAPASDAATRTFLVKIDLPANVAALQPGQFVKIAWPDGKNENLVVPASAVSLFGQMERLFVAGDNGRANLRVVKTGARRNDMIEILAGLSAGEKVVIDGADSLRDGQPLEARP